MKVLNGQQTIVYSFLGERLEDFIFLDRITKYGSLLIPVMSVETQLLLSPSILS